jgi:hypothetical protein
MLLAFDGGLWEVDTEWALSWVTVYDINTQEEISIVSASTEPWHFVDFYNTWMLFRPGSSLIKTNYEGMFGETNRVYQQDSTSVNTGCAFRGRLLIGGFSPSDFWNVEWQALLDYWSGQYKFTIDPTLSMGCNFVMWSAIGGGNILDLFMPSRAVDGVIKESSRSVMDPAYFDSMRRNDSGFMPMTFRGAVLVLKELGNGVIAYGEDGISALVPVSSPEPTFGLRKIADFGVFGRGAVGGDENQHVFMDWEGDSWVLEQDTQSLHSATNYMLKRIGYKEFFSGFTVPMVSYDNRRKEFHLASEASSYVLTEQGLGQESQMPTSLFRYKGSLVGVATADESSIAMVVTDVFDFGIRDLKTVTTVELGIITTGDVYVAVDYRYNKADAFTRSAYVKVNKEGFARIQITALEFRFCVGVVYFAGTSLYSFIVHWQLSGKRTIRGMYANTANA